MQQRQALLELRPAGILVIDRLLEFHLEEAIVGERGLGLHHREARNAL
jgi:hypothetical protein